jgi:hypothetical protein
MIVGEGSPWRNPDHARADLRDTLAWYIDWGFTRDDVLTALELVKPTEGGDAQWILPQSC